MENTFIIQNCFLSNNFKSPLLDILIHPDLQHVLLIYSDGICQLYNLISKSIIFEDSIPPLASNLIMTPKNNLVYYDQAKDCFFCAKIIKPLEWRELERTKDKTSKSTVIITKILIYKQEEIVLIVDSLASKLFRFSLIWLNEKLDGLKTFLITSEDLNKNSLISEIINEEFIFCSFCNETIIGLTLKLNENANEQPKEFILEYPDKKFMNLVSLGNFEEKVYLLVVDKQKTNFIFHELILNQETKTSLLQQAKKIENFIPEDLENKTVDTIIRPETDCYRITGKTMFQIVLFILPENIKTAYMQINFQSLEVNLIKASIQDIRQNGLMKFEMSNNFPLWVEYRREENYATKRDKFQQKFLKVRKISCDSGLGLLYLLEQKKIPQIYGSLVVKEILEFLLVKKN